MLAELGGCPLTKIRWRWSEARRGMVVDEFGGPLTGLVLAEVELEPDEARRSWPSFTLADVTDEDRFSGGALSRTTAAQLDQLLTLLPALQADIGKNADSST